MEGQQVDSQRQAKPAAADRAENNIVEEESGHEQWFRVQNSVIFSYIGHIGLMFS
mgnify:CR=1 FL=1